MARDGDIIRTADICDDHGDQILVCETALIDYAKRNHFHGQVVTFSTFEDNKGVRDVMAEGGAGKVLVVDDQSGIRGLLSRYLSGQGLEVRSAADGEEAFRSLLSDPPDIMLLDLYLPRLNGHDLLRRMQEMEISVDLIFTMSGYADTADAQECLRLGATDHLMKPIDLDRLHRNIQLRVGTRAKP